MRNRPGPRPGSERDQIVQRRLDLLRAELAQDWRAPTRPAGWGESATQGEREIEGEPEREIEPARGMELPAAVGADWWDGRTRIAGLRPSDPPPAWPPDEEDGTETPLLPMPGRHASRRVLDLAALVPEPLRGRVELGPGPLALLAVVVALALAATCWLVLRSSASTISAAPGSSLAAASPLLGEATSMRSGAADASADASGDASGDGSVGAETEATSPVAVGQATSDPSRIVVDVEGPVRHPGLVELRAGSRVADAVRAAGGVPHRRLLGGANLAAPLTDGEQVVVGAAAAPAAPAAPEASGSGGPTAKIDLNTATAEALEEIPGIGPVTAQAIVSWREQNGRFSSIDELQEINGIGPAKESDIAPYVTL